jgi:aryl-alcohol dehydrogenase-like predicted oxidoreductase
MAYAQVTLGATPIARMGLGTNRLTNTAENVAFIRQAVAAGIGMIDTAHLYTRGDSEATIGSALEGSAREGCVVATKGGYGRGQGRPEVLADQLEESLRRLRTDRIDLYYLHKVDPDTPLEESLGAIKEQRDRGRVRYVGVSNVSLEQLERARQVVEIAAVQNHYNVAEREGEDVVDYCAEHGIVFVPYFPLGAGGSPRDALAWLLERSATTVPIPGTLSIEHLRENLAVAAAGP